MSSAKRGTGDKCKIYQANGTREKNKARKMARHMNNFPNDAKCKDAFKKWKDYI